MVQAKAWVAAKEVVTAELVMKAKVTHSIR